MPTKSTQDQLQACVDNFVAELSVIVQQATVEQIQEAIGAGLAAPLKHRAFGGPTKRVRRSTENVEAVGGKVAAYVASNPGCAVGDIAGALGLTSKQVRLPIQKLLADGALRTTGQRRGTRYHSAKKAGGSGAAARKPRAVKKKATRKKRSR